MRKADETWGRNQLHKLSPIKMILLETNINAPLLLLLHCGSLHSPSHCLIRQPAENKC